MARRRVDDIFFKTAMMPTPSHFIMMKRAKNGLPVDEVTLVS